MASSESSRSILIMQSPFIILQRQINSDADVLSRKLEQVVRLFPTLQERQSMPARVLSGGERQMLAISLPLMTAPQLLMLDEPSAGLAPIMVKRLFDAIARLQSELGTTVLLVEQNVNEALHLASAPYVMQEGNLVFAAPSSQRDEIIHHLWALSTVARGSTQA